MKYYLFLVLGLLIRPVQSQIFFQSEVNKIQERYKNKINNNENYIVFTGSSSIRMWKDLPVLFENSKKKNQTNVASAWSSYQSKKSLLNSVRAQVSAAEIANEGITLEYDSGSKRTTIEVIQSRTLLLGAKIANAEAEKELMLSKFKLLAILGNLKLENINNS